MAQMTSNSIARQLIRRRRRRPVREPGLLCGRAEVGIADSPRGKRHSRGKGRESLDWVEKS